MSDGKNPMSGEHPIRNAFLTVEDEWTHEVWAVPVRLIAQDRAKFYADEFGGDLQRSLEEDTWPLVEDDDYEIKDWAAGNMNWSDVKEHAVQVAKPEPPDFQEMWVSGAKDVKSAAAIEEEYGKDGKSQE